MSAHQPKDATVRVRVIDGTWETLGASTAAGIWHENLELNWDRWGPSAASFDVRRSSVLPWPDLRAFTDVEIEVAGVRVWSGRISSTPTRDGADVSINVQCEGMQYHLDDDLYTPFYVHTKLDDWKDGRSFLDADLARWMATGDVASDGGISLMYPNATTTQNQQYLGVVLDLGPTVLAKRIAITVQWVGIASAAYQLYVRGNTSVAAMTVTANDAIGPINQPAASTVSYSGTFPTASRYVTIFYYRNGTTGAVGNDQGLRITSAKVFTDAAYESGGESVLKASTVITDALSKATVLLDTDRSLIQATSFNIPDFHSYEPRTPRETWDAVNALHGYYSKIDEFNRPVYSPLPSSPAIEVGSWTAMSGTDAAQSSGKDIYNRVLVTGQSPTGDPVRFERYTDAVLDALGLAQPSNPTATTDTSGWTTTVGFIARDTSVFDSAPAGFRAGANAEGLLGVSTTVTATLKKGFRYRATMRIRATTALNIDGLYISAGPVTLNYLGRPSTSAFETVAFDWVQEADAASYSIGFGASGTVGSSFIYFDSIQVGVVAPTLVDRRGFRRTMVLPINAPLDSAGTVAAAIGDAFLNNHKLAQFKGDYQITGPVRTILSGDPVPPERLGSYTGHLLRFGDRIDPDTGAVGRDGRIASVTYSLATDSATVSIDNTSSNFEHMLERLALISGSG